MRDKLNKILTWVFWTFIAFSVILTGYFLYTIWNSLARLGNETLATMVLMLIGSHFVMMWLSFRLGRSDAFHFIRGFDTGTERTVDVMRRTGSATSKQSSITLEPPLRPVQIIPRQLMSGAEEGEIIDL